MKSYFHTRMKTKRKTRIGTWMVGIFVIGILLFLIVVFFTNKKVTITYAAWNLGPVDQPSLERRMIEQYQSEHPEVEIVILEEFTKDYNKAMEEAVLKDQLPDVFMYSGNPLAEEKGWCYDLTKLCEDDKEWKLIPSVLQEAAVVKGKIVCIPSAIHFLGYYGNVNLLEGNTAFQEAFTYEFFEKAVKSMTDLKAGRIGLADASSFIDWYPAYQNIHYGWYSWDGGKLNLTSHEFQEAIQKQKDLNQGGYTFAGLSEEERSYLHVENDWEAWIQGKIGFKFDGTWVSDYYNGLEDEYAFFGMPGGRTCIVPDFLFLSSQTTVPKEAYEFAKYMSAFSEKGYMQRLTFAEQEELLMNSMPMISFEGMKEKFQSLESMKGLWEAYENYVKYPEQAYVELVKILPGYNEARWNYQTTLTVGDVKQATIAQVLDACGFGRIEFSSLAKELNYLANTSVKIYPQQLQH